MTVGTLHLAVRDKAIELLQAADPALADGGVVKGRRKRPMAAQYARQVYVYLDTSLPQRAQLTYQPDDWLTRVRIECAARDTDAYTGEENADDMAKRCYALLAADPSWGGLLMDLIPLGLAWDADEGDTELAVTQLAFDARHRTPATSIAA